MGILKTPTPREPGPHGNKCNLGKRTSPWHTTIDYVRAHPGIWMLVAETDNPKHGHSLASNLATLAPDLKVCQRGLLVFAKSPVDVADHPV